MDAPQKDRLDEAGTGLYPGAGSSDIDTRDPDLVDAAAEKKIVRKLDMHIIPLVMLLYLFSFLDR